MCCLNVWTMDCLHDSTTGAKFRIATTACISKYSSTQAHSCFAANNKLKDGSN